MLHLNDENNNVYSVDDSQEINRGGEGRILNIKGMPDKVAKIYLDKKQSFSVQRINELNPLPSYLFIKPLTPLYGSENGFIMDKLGVNFFSLDALYSTSFAMKRGVPTNYKEKIAKQMIVGVQEAHSHHIIIGDINPFNILINDTCTVKFIDVDSYETASHKHSGVLLENIRDYYFGGKVSEESDYFALAVITFNLLTGLHPYKGFHNVYGNAIKDRMVNNLSVLSKEEKNIKIPHFYQKLGDDKLSDMFKDIFNLNKRYLISMDGKTIQAVSFAGTILSDKLLLTEIFSTMNSQEQIIEVTTSNGFMNIKTNKCNHLYETPNKGIVKPLNDIYADINVILTNNNVWTFRGGRLSLYVGQTKASLEITNFCLTKDEIYLVKQYENILVIITKDDKMYKVYLDEVVGTSVKYNVSLVYSESFKKTEGLFQTIGTNSMIYYNNGQGLNSVSIQGNSIKDVVQKNNVGIMTTMVNNKVEYELFSIDKFNKIKKATLSDICPFTFDEQYIILLKDNHLSFVGKDTLQEVCAFEITMKGNYSILNTNAGIILYDDNKVILANSR